MNTVLRFPGGATVLPEPTTAKLIASAAEWVALVGDDAADLRMCAALLRPDLRGAFEAIAARIERHAERATRILREAEGCK